jgi:O-antigen/teichoic acid export membrane protein
LNILRRLPIHRASANLIFGYFATAYSALVALAFTPVILRILGPEAFGLVGIFLVILACSLLFDAAITPTASRESARFRGGAETPVNFKSTLRGLEIVVLGIAIPVVVLALAFSEALAQRWINRETLSLDEVSFALAIMILIVLARVWCGFRRGVLIGFERHASLHTINVLVASLRYPVQVLFLSWVTPSARLYFCYQLAISVLEVAILWGAARPLMPVVRPVALMGCLRLLRPLSRLAFLHMLLALVWLVVTQTDKVMLSKLLTLSQFGYFSLVIAAASGVILMSTPITQMLAPRLVKLHAEANTAGFIATYHRYTKIVAVFSGTAAIFCAFFGQELIFAWTGDSSLADRIGPVLAWYSVGNALMGLSGLPYFVQNAMGTLRWHLYGSFFFMALIFPALLWSAPRYGMLGAAIAWAGANLVHTLIWVPVSHRAVLPGIHWRWLCDGVLRVVLPTTLTALLVAKNVNLPGTRLNLTLVLLLIGLGLLAVAVSSSGLLTRKVFRHDHPDSQQLQ